MDRPHGTQDRNGADAARRAAQLHAAHAAATARRGAAAHRRGVLAGLLLAATVVGWTVVGIATLPALAAVVPTALLVGVLGLGRHAVVQGRAAEDEWQRRTAEAAAPLRECAARPGRTGAEGRAVRPSSTDTQVIAQVRASDGAADRTSDGVRSGGREGDTWSPVAVPKPTYTMKAPAPRREPAPLGEVEASTLVTPARSTTTDRDEAVRTARPAAETVGPAASVASSTAGPGVSAPAAPVVATGATAPATSEPTGSIDLDAVLARRRASGE